MELQKTPVTGGIGILHRVKDGKHRYEVDTVFNENTGLFMRKGDQLLKINDSDMQDLTPREFADLLSSGNPMLRIHHAGADHPMKAPEKTGDFRAVFKEDTVLTFSMDMAMDLDLQVEDDGCDQDELEAGLLVELVGTCVEMVLGRGCGHGETCQKCSSTSCSLKDLVVMSEDARVEAVEPCDLKRQDTETKAIVNLLYERFLSYKTTKSQNKAILKGKKDITIYYYEQINVGPYEGIPVVLNFTDTKLFLQCSKTYDGVHLSVVECEKDLECISKSDKEMGFVFFMKGNRSEEHTFESANCKGWFVEATSTTKVDAAETTEPMKSLYFLIQEC
ncbi:uncharacterized protein LOC143141901 isoform X2 [Alosa pseudoharengus]|uniref:uncharacterized protein LOC143141901 isoform X2 n=1 Tax=Alosa pseudoharengus TaxID=34774 RepID=UPI003F898376